MTAEGMPNSALRINRVTLLFWRRFHSAVTSILSRYSKPSELNEASWIWFANSAATATTFSPNKGMTRGMFVTVLGRMAGADISAYNTQSQFADVDSKMYYNAYVNWAAANKIVSGVDASHFNPNALITREQAAVIMNNYLTATGT